MKRQQKKSDGADKPLHSDESITERSPAERRRFQSAVLKWYDKHGRRLPWRTSSDPYRIWLSEIMLQQTTVAAVLPYFERFTAAFPAVTDLAAAEVDDVLRLWEGLGYYSRARNLHRAAQELCRDHNGTFPPDVNALQALPGIGRYTAGAIASFAFGLPAPIVEANTERLYARLIGLPIDVRSTAGQKALWQFSSEMVPTNRAGDFNQALMDLGAGICTPQNPSCGDCPLRTLCKACQLGRQAEIPVRKTRVAMTAIEEIAVVLSHKGRILLRRRADGERWAGMWDFVRFELSAEEVALLPLVDRKLTKLSTSKASASKSPASKAKPKRSVPTRPQRSLFESADDRLPDAFDERIRLQSGRLAATIRAATEFQYTVTRYKVRLTCFMCESQTPPRPGRDQGSDVLNWFAVNQLSELPMSQTGRRIANWLAAVTTEPSATES